MNGKEIPKFASVSRIARDEKGQLEGYQRPEIQEHIADIQTYFEKRRAILPNALVVAFNQELEFEATQRTSGNAEIGVLKVPIGQKNKAGWVVDGQQRLAALRQMKREGEFWVPIIGLESQSVDDEREQFVLVNNARPLPKSLVYELYPSLGDAILPARNGASGPISRWRGLHDRKSPLQTHPHNDGPTPSDREHQISPS